MNIIIVAAAFMTTILLIEGLYYLFRTSADNKKERVRRRIQPWTVQEQTSTTPTLMRQVILSDIPWLNRLLIRIPMLRSLALLLEQADQPLSMGTFLLLSLALCLTGLVAGTMLSRHMMVGLAFAAGASMLPWMWLRLKKRARNKRFEQQLPEALDLIARALQAGHTLMVGMKMVGDEMPDPIGTEFLLTVEAISYGADVHEALLDLSSRVECADLRFFITAILLQRETGGNLAEILAKTSTIIRQRFELLGRIQVLAAEGKFSAMVLTALPFAVGALLYIINPKYISLLFTDSLGQILAVSAAVSMLLGIFFIKKTIAIKV